MDKTCHGCRHRLVGSQSYLGNGMNEMDELRRVLRASEAFAGLQIALRHSSEVRHEAEVKRLREALALYADDNNWCYDTCNIGREPAKDALTGIHTGE